MKINQTNPHLLNIIEKSIELIEENIKGKLNLEFISKSSGFSKYHLHRIFHSITGKTLISYVRERKLSKSLMELNNTSWNIIDIASEYGYDYEQSYIRSFYNVFGITPAQYRITKPELAITQKIDVKYFEIIKDGFLVEPKIITKPSFFIQGFEGHIVHDDNYYNKTTNALVSEFEDKYLYNIKNAVAPHVYYGYVRYSDDPLTHNFYMPSTETTVLNPAFSPLKSVTVPANEYAVFRYIGLHSPYETTYETLHSLYRFIEDRWLIDTSFKNVFSYHFEKLDLKVCSDNYCEMDIYIPISIN